MVQQIVSRIYRLSKDVVRFSLWMIKLSGLGFLAFSESCIFDLYFETSPNLEYIKLVITRI